MTVALVLATATACDRAPKPASSAAQRGQAVSRRGAGARPGRGYRGSIPSTTGLPPPGSRRQGRPSGRPPDLRQDLHGRTVHGRAFGERRVHVSAGRCRGSARGVPAAAEPCQRTGHNAAAAHQALRPAMRARCPRHHLDRASRPWRPPHGDGVGRGVPGRTRAGRGGEHRRDRVRLRRRRAAGGSGGHASPQRDGHRGPRLRR